MKRIKADKLILAVFAVFVLLMGGCSTATLKHVKPSGGPPFVVTVESIAIADADLKNKTYVFTSALKNVSTDDIQFKEFARYIENALSKKGYKRVDSKNADLIIRLAYGIGKPKTVSNTQSYTASAGYSYQVGWTWVHVPAQTKTVTTKSTSYARFLILEAYDSKDRRSQLWRTQVTSSGSSGNLRRVLPRMVAAATYNFGTNTIGKPIHTRVYENSARVLSIMRSSNLPSEAPFTETEKEKLRLGVRVELLSNADMPYLPDHRLRAGVLVTRVAENSVAKIMGLQKYDIILTVNNKPVLKPVMLVEEIKKTKPGGEIRLTFFSWKKLQDVFATGSLK